MSDPTDISDFTEDELKELDKLFWDESEFQREDLKKNINRRIDKVTDKDIEHLIFLKILPNDTIWMMTSRNREVSIDTGIIRSTLKLSPDEFQRNLDKVCAQCGVSRDDVLVEYELAATPIQGIRLETALWLWCRDYGALYSKRGE